PCPQELAALRVVTADHAGRRVLVHAVLHLPAHDHDITHDHRRNVLAVPAGLAHTDALHQADFAAAAEIGAGLASLGVDREQPRIHGPLDDAGAAGLVGRRIWNGV